MNVPASHADYYIDLLILLLILLFHLFDINGGHSSYGDYRQPWKKPFDFAE